MSADWLPIDFTVSAATVPGLARQVSAAVSDAVTAGRNFVVGQYPDSKLYLYGLLSPRLDQGITEWLAITLRRIDPALLEANCVHGVLGHGVVHVPLEPGEVVIYDWLITADEDELRQVHDEWGIDYGYELCLTPDDDEA